MRKSQVKARFAFSTFIVGFSIALTPAARAAEKLTVGKVSASSFMFSPLDVGVAKGIFQANGLDIEIINFNGSAKGHQAMAAGALDLLLGGGVDLAFIVRGAPEIGIAAISNSPDLGFIASYNSPFKTLDDLKGKTIGVSTAGSVTAWLANDLARVKGWGPHGVTPIEIGNQRAGEVVAIKTGEVDAFIETNVFGLQLEQTKDGRLIAPASDYVKNFVANAMFASDKIVKNNPDAVRRFVKSWFETIAFMRHNKKEAVPLVRKVTGYDEALESRDYDLTMPDMSSDGKFSPKAMKTMAQSFVQLKILDTAPDMSKLYTDRFLPPN